MAIEKTVNALVASDREKYESGDLIIIDLEDRYNEHINEVCSADVSINGTLYKSASDFKENDPTGYSIGLKEYGDTMFDDSE